MEKVVHKILALKYRPKNFNELIGQDIAVETIKNSILSKKLPNAYLLSGIRGVGKTTTARLIAQAINCKKNFIQGEKCNPGEYCSCKEINEFKNLDVIEIDGAQHTGVDSTKELIASCMYAPTTVKYKVIIADEFQMLSKSSFAALLKTLEEPPPHLKFVFCTTEVKKIPITIISRCQRFDLHRVSIKDLLENLNKISKIENGKISEGALILIAKAAEGSVRDSLSLLDRALVSQDIEEKEIDETYIRKMLGLADKSKLLRLLNFIFQGNQKESLESLRELINEGVEPSNFLNDLLEIIYFIQQKKNIGNLDSDLSISESEQEAVNLMSNNVSTSTLIVFWQLILKVLEELSIVSSPILSLEMLVVRLVHLEGMPSYEDVLESLKKNNSSQAEVNSNVTIDRENDKKIFSNETDEIANISKDQIKNTTQTKPILSSLNPKNLPKDIIVGKISSFEELILLSARKKEIQLKYDLENNVNLIKFSEGKIDISFNENLDKNFVRNLSKKLLEWTGTRWVITLTKKIGKKTFSELQSIKKKELLDQEKKGEIYKKFKNIFSDGELLEVKKED
ncbi:MAG TPA: DNA polymerase III subunit gamma/tau [Pelagibacteraceae bacterium]|jgi:DNA polymerase-3 subunit gamma/tau|nr:DNA polymerase III subunit gamma/tau [Pelagibacteraceae bacterium]